MATLEGVWSEKQSSISRLGPNHVESWVIPILCAEEPWSLLESLHTQLLKDTAQCPLTETDVTRNLLEKAWKASVGELCGKDTKSWFIPQTGGGHLQKCKVIWPEGKWNWEKWRIQCKHLVPDLASDRGPPKWNTLQSHLSFPAAPQVSQTFKCTQDTHQRMESQITSTAMCLGSIHPRLKSNCWRMGRRWNRSSQTCLSARTGLSTCCPTLSSPPTAMISIAAEWLTLLSHNPRQLSGVSFQVLWLTTDGCMWAEPWHKAALI